MKCQPDLFATAFFHTSGIPGKRAQQGYLCRAVTKESGGKGRSREQCCMRGLKDHIGTLESRDPTMQ